MRNTVRQLIFVFSCIVSILINAGPSQSKLKSKDTCPNQALHTQHTEQHRTISGEIANNTPLLLPLAKIVAQYASHHVWQEEARKKLLGHISTLKVLNPSCVIAVGGSQIGIWDLKQQKEFIIPGSYCDTELAVLNADEFVYSMSDKCDWFIANVVDDKKNRKSPKHKVAQICSLTPLASDRFAVGHHRRGVGIWDAQQCKQLAQLPRGPYGSQIGPLFPMPNDMLLVCYDDPHNGAVYMFDLKTQTKKWSFSYIGRIIYVEQYEGGDILLIEGSRSGDVDRGIAPSIIYRLDSRTGVQKFRYPINNYIGHAQKLPDNSFALGTGTGEMLLLNQRGEIKSIKPTHSAAVSCMALIADKILVSGSHDGSVILRNLSGDTVAKLTHEAAEETQTAAANTDQTLQAAATGTNIKTEAGVDKKKKDKPAINAVAVLSETCIATGDRDGNVIIWEYGLCNACS